MADIVNALFLRCGTVLLARRSAERRAYPNRWSFPGGHVEPGETLQDALVRELGEEVGVRPLSFEKVGVIEEPDPEANGEITYHMFAVTVWDRGEPFLVGDEHSEIRWFQFSAACRILDLAIIEYRAILQRCAALTGAGSSD